MCMVVIYELGGHKQTNKGIQYHMIKHTNYRLHLTTHMLLRSTNQSKPELFNYSASNHIHFTVIIQNIPVFQGIWESRDFVKIVWICPPCFSQILVISPVLQGSPQTASHFPQNIILTIPFLLCACLCSVNSHHNTNFNKFNDCEEQLSTGVCPDFILMVKGLARETNFSTVAVTELKSICRLFPATLIQALQQAIWPILYFQKQKLLHIKGISHIRN